MAAKKKSMGKQQAPTSQSTQSPNLYWRSMSMDQLREQPRCIALAPVTQPLADNSSMASHRYVRQDSQLWSELHDGMLTTGRLKAALGMHERSAASIIGIHPGSRGSSYLTAAYCHLVNTTYSRGMATSTAAGNSSSNNSAPLPSSSTAAAQQRQQGEHPHRRTKKGQQQQPQWQPKQQQEQQQAPQPQQQQQQQQQQYKRFGGLLPRAVMLQAPSQQYHTQAPQQADQQKQQRQLQQQHQAAADIMQLEARRCLYNQQLSSTPFRSFPQGSLAVPDLQQSSACIVEAARQHSARVAAAGDMSVKMSWGKTQEAAALYSVMQLFPQALLEEVGLFEFDAAQLPAVWGIQPQLLPPLGASPDGMLVHKLTLLPEDLKAAAALLGRVGNSNSSSRGSGSSNGQSNSGKAGSSSSSNGAGSNGSSSGSGPPGSGPPGWAEAAAEAAAVQLLLQRGYDRLACSGSKPPPSGVQYADSSDDDGSVPSSSHSSSCGSGVNSGAEIGTQDGGQAGSSSSSTSSSSAKAQEQRVPGAGSSGGSNSSIGNNGATGSSSSSVSVQQAGSLGFEPVGTTVLRALRQWQQQQQQEGAVRLIIREAVEVKNHCPFGVRFSHRRADQTYKLSPRGVAGRVHPQWMPQLQLHMLATGCQSVLLVSRCAAQGMRAYRVWRDDTYLRDMLRLLQELQVSHVLRRVPPRPDSLSRLPAHRPFLQRTVSLARAAECIAAVGEDFVAHMPANAVNQTPFWV